MIRRNGMTTWQSVPVAWLDNSSKERGNRFAINSRGDKEKKCLIKIKPNQPK